MASSDAFSELPNFALEGDFPEDVELIPTQTCNGDWYMFPPDQGCCYL
jgi:hypothetical protein